MKKSLLFAIVALLFCLFSSNVLAKDLKILRPSNAQFSSPETYCDWVFKGNWARIYTTDSTRTCGERPYKGTSLFRWTAENMKFTKPQYKLNAILAGIENPKALKEDLEWALSQESQDDHKIRLAVGLREGWKRKYLENLRTKDLGILYWAAITTYQMDLTGDDIDFLAERFPRDGHVSSIVFSTAENRPYIFTKSMCKNASNGKYRWGSYRMAPLPLHNHCSQYDIALLPINPEKPKAF